MQGARGKNNKDKGGEKPEGTVWEGRECGGKV